MGAGRGQVRSRGPQVRIESGVFRLVRGLGGSALPTAAEAAAVAVHLQYMHVVGEAVQQGSPVRRSEPNTSVHSSKGRLVVTRMEPRSQRWVKTSKSSSAPVGDRGTKPSSSMISRPRRDRFRCRVSSRLSSQTSSGPLYFVVTGATPQQVPQPVYFAAMALLDHRICRMVAESGETARAGGPGWKQPCLRPRLGIPPCRSSGGGWKTRFIAPWQDGILLPIPARGAAG